RDGVGVVESNVFLRLQVAGREIVDRADGDRRVRPLRGGDAGEVGVGGVGGVIDVQVLAAVGEVRLDRADAVLQRIRPAKVAEHLRVGRHLGGEQIDLGFEVALRDGRAGRLQELVHYAAQPAEVGLFQVRVGQDQV